VNQSISWISHTTSFADRVQTHTHIYDQQSTNISAQESQMKPCLAPYVPTTTLLCAKGCCCSLHLLLPHYKVHNTTTTTTIDKSMIFVSVNNFKRVLQVPTSLPLLKPKQAGWTDQLTICMYVCMCVYVCFTIITW
jgi:hypothetical protein